MNESIFRITDYDLLGNYNGNILKVVKGKKKISSYVTYTLSSIGCYALSGYRNCEITNTQGKSIVEQVGKKRREPQKMLVWAGSHLTYLYFSLLSFLFFVDVYKAPTGKRRFPFLI